MKIVLIGSGQVATHLGAALLQSVGHQIVQVYSRLRANAEALAERLTEVRAEAVTFTDQLSEVNRDADLYIICVSDQAIHPVIKELSAAGESLRGIIVHTSGSTPISVFSEAVVGGYPGRHGVFYPIQTFSKAKAVNFRQIPLALEAGTPETYSILEGLARELSDQVFPCDSVQRQAIHIAAVFACNFTNYLYALGEKVLDTNGLGFDLIRPLIAETAEKAMQHSPTTVQTGPAVRGDMTIVQKHLDYLAAEHPAMAEIYRLLSEGISGE